MADYYRAKATEQTNLNRVNSKKFHVDQWQGVAHILSAGYNTALSMIFVDDETLAKEGIPIGQRTVILKFMQTTQW